MAGELRDSVARGVAWSVAEKIGTMLLQAGVSIVVLRLLMPDDFGVIAVLTAFAAFAVAIVDSGFSQTLIRRPDPAPHDYRAVFFFNIAASLGAYLLLTALAPAVASYYDMPVIVRIAPVFFLLLPVNALCVIQHTIFTRQFRFALLSKITFVSSLVSGLFAVGLAAAGCGVWALVAQRVSQMAVRALLLWCLSEWRPRGGGRIFAPLRSMAPYSFSLLASDLISAVYNKIPQLFIGRLYSADALGFFDQAVKLKDLPVTSAMTAVQGVTFPALARISDSGPKFAESYRQVVLVVAYVLFPVMLGLSAVSEDLFTALLGSKWLPTVPYFRTICFAGLFYPVAMVAYNVLKVRCSGPEIFRLEIIKKVGMTLILLLTIPRSVQAVVWGLVAFAFFEMAVNVGASLRVARLSLWRFVRTLLPVVFVSAVMFLCVRGVSRFLPDPGALRLCIRIAVGVGVYLLLSVLFRLEAFSECLSICRRQFGVSLKKN